MRIYIYIHVIVNIFISYIFFSSEDVGVVKHVTLHQRKIAAPCEFMREDSRIPCLLDGNNAHQTIPQKDREN